MSMTQILGAVALVIGLVLLGFAYQASNAPMEQVSDALTGRYTNQTMWYLILGIAAAVGGCPPGRIRQTEIEWGQGRLARRAEPAGARERA
jgi:Protein of unknown function (DUF3185)